MKKNVFIVNTEYHLVLTLGIIQQYFSIGYDNIVCRVSPIKRSRLNNLDFEGTGIEYYEIIYDYQNPTKELKYNLQHIIDLKPSTLFVYLENKFWMNYLFSKLHQMGTRIILGPDGMKAYNNKGYKSMQDNLRYFMKGLYHSAKTHLLTTWPHVEKTYASSKYIDDVWVEQPDFYSNTSNKNVIKFQYTIDESFVELLNHVFCVNERDLSVIRHEPSILFLDTVFQSDEYYERTFKILEKFRAKYPELKLLVKYHPLSKTSAKEIYSKIPNTVELNSDYPAEIYIAAAKESIIVSLVSTSELFYNPNCNYIWLYKLYEDLYDYKSLVNPTKYIRVVGSIEEIE